MTHTVVEAIYAIRHKATGEYIKFGSKCAWATKGAATAAFQLHAVKYNSMWEKPKFSEQDDYEVINLLDFMYEYDGD